MIKTDLKSLCSGAFSDMLYFAPIDQTKISLAPPSLSIHVHIHGCRGAGAPPLITGVRDLDRRQRGHRKAGAGRCLVPVFRAERQPAARPASCGAQGPRARDASFDSQAHSFRGGRRSGDAAGLSFLARAQRHVVLRSRVS
jgi:hypothetical protein